MRCLPVIRQSHSGVSRIRNKGENTNCQFLHEPCEAVNIIQMVHEVVGSKIFKDTYIDICVNGRWENLFGKNGGPPETHSIWQILKSCDLDVVNPSPLDTTLMDKEILVSMAYLTAGVPPHEWAGDPLLSKVAYNEGQVPAGMFKQDG